MKILYLSPHTDDVELACSGYILKYPEHKHTIINFSDCGIQDIHEETERAAAILDAESIILDYERREFNYSRQHILNHIIHLRDKYKPDLVFIPHPTDTHQDHEVISKEGIRAFKKNCNIVFYPTHNLIDFTPNYFEVLDSEIAGQKIEVLSQYRSQKDKWYFQPENIRARMILSGEKVNEQYAEEYQIYQLIHQQL